MPAWLTVVGIGEDGFGGLGRAARRALLGASVIVGGERHLAMLPARLRARRERWPRPFDIAPVLALRGTPVCVLASGDPMFHGVGATLARALPRAEFAVLPSVSSPSLAAARLGWALQDVGVISLVGRPLATLNAHVRDGARLLVLSRDGRSPAEIAELLDARGFGASVMHLFEHLGGPAERWTETTAQACERAEVARLNLVALECRAGGAARAVSLPLVSGLPDQAFSHDGQLTKRDVRAIVLARLAPLPGALLWDVGAGCGSIGIEWMRAHPSCRAIAVEADAGRQDFIARNRDTLGVPGLQVVAGRAPEALHGLPEPDAVFIGGGVTTPGVLETCWAGLREGGRLVANAVTLEGEAALVAWRARHGGALTRIALAHAQPLGGFKTWRQALPVTLYEATKPFGQAPVALEAGHMANGDARRDA